MFMLHDVTADLDFDRPHLDTCLDTAFAVVDSDRPDVAIGRAFATALRDKPLAIEPTPRTQRLVTVISGFKRFPLPDASSRAQTLNIISIVRARLSLHGGIRTSNTSARRELSSREFAGRCAAVG